MKESDMTDQCFDEPDRGREPEPVPYVPEWDETWTTVGQAKVYRNVASKLELAKKYIKQMIAERYFPSTVTEIGEQALKELEDE